MNYQSFSHKPSWMRNGNIEVSSLGVLFLENFSNQTGVAPGEGMK